MEWTFWPRHAHCELLWRIPWRGLYRDGNANSNRSRGEKSSLDQFFQAISVEKRLMFHRTNRCLGCVGYLGLYEGRIYRNRGETILFVLVISNINIGFHKLLTLPLINLHICMLEAHCDTTEMAKSTHTKVVNLFWTHSLFILSRSNTIMILSNILRHKEDMTRKT